MKKTTTTLKNNVERINFCIKALKNLERSFKKKTKQDIKYKNVIIYDNTVTFGEDNVLFHVDKGNVIINKIHNNGKS